MGMLRVLVNGAWVDIPGLPGPGVPVGGAAGTVLVKQSANDFDTAWTSLIGAPISVATGPAQASPGITVLPATHATSRRAQISLDQWQIMQDLTANGTKDFAIWNGGVTALNITTSWDSYFAGEVYGGVNKYFRVRGNSGIFWQDWGGGWYMQDSTWLRSYADKNIFTGGVIRTAGGSSSAFQFQGNGYQLNHYTDTDTGFYYVSDGDCGIVCNGAWSIRCRPDYAYIKTLRFYSPDDSNHAIAYSSNTPPQSGEASNGPIVQGYSSVWLYNLAYGKSLFLNSGGNVFINAGNGYQQFSSRRFKHNIETLDPKQALAAVLQWRPVSFDWNEDLNTPRLHDFGFISEEMIDVTPSLVNVTRDEDETPNWANAINYASTAPWLAGAVQALLDRIEALEQRLAEEAA